MPDDVATLIVSFIHFPTLINVKTSTLFSRQAHGPAVLKGFSQKKSVWKRVFFFPFSGYILLWNFVTWSDLLGPHILGHLDVMKLRRLSVMLFVLHTSISLLYFSGHINASSSSDMTLNQRHVESNECFSATPLNRKLKDNKPTNPRRKSIRSGDVNLYDYSPIDPVPSSKRSINHGPIEHGSPLIPHVPNLSPPPDQTQPGSFV